MKSIYNVKDTREKLRKQSKNLNPDYRKRLVYMSPTVFLSKVPSMRPQHTSAVHMKEEDYDQGSLSYIRNQIKNKEKLQPLELDYQVPWFGYPSHEGRHRAYVSSQYGIKKVPVVVRGKP